MPKDEEKNIYCCILLKGRLRKIFLPMSGFIKSTSLKLESHFIFDAILNLQWVYIRVICFVKRLLVLHYLTLNRKAFYARGTAPEFFIELIGKLKPNILKVCHVSSWWSNVTNFELKPSSCSTMTSQGHVFFYVCNDTGRREAYERNVTMVVQHNGRFNTSDVMYGAMFVYYSIIREMSHRQIRHTG